MTSFPGLSESSIAIVGLGLMGGSLAAALSARRACRRVIGVARRLDQCRDDRRDRGGQRGQSGGPGHASPGDPGTDRPTRPAAAGRLPAHGPGQHQIGRAGGHGGSAGARPPHRRTSDVREGSHWPGGGHGGPVRRPALRPLAAGAHTARRHAAGLRFGRCCRGHAGAGRCRGPRPHGGLGESSAAPSGASVDAGRHGRRPRRPQPVDAGRREPLLRAGREFLAEFEALCGLLERGEEAELGSRIAEAVVRRRQLGQEEQSNR